VLNRLESPIRGFGLSLGVRCDNRSIIGGGRFETTMFESDLHIDLAGAPPAAIRRRAQRAAVALEKDLLKRHRAQSSEVDKLRSAYRKDLSALLGAERLRRYRELRRQTKKLTPARRMREADKFIDSVGIDRRRVAAVQRKHTNKVAKVLANNPFPGPGPVSMTDSLSPIDDPYRWFSYRPPYVGSLWSYSKTHSDGASDPEMRRYLNHRTGQIGSRISLRVDDADDRDEARGDYYTSLLAWHMTHGAGPIEGHLVFSYVRSTYSGNIGDEFGFSAATHQQWADVYLRVIDPQGTDDVSSSPIFGYADNVWGESDAWNEQVAPPGDFRGAGFATSKSFPAGRWLLLEVGVSNSSWFFVDDQSITMSDDLELRLDEIRLHSRPGPTVG
jgi:hypothetical protein